MVSFGNNASLVKVSSLLYFKIHNPYDARARGESAMIWKRQFFFYFLSFVRLHDAMKKKNRKKKYACE